MMHENYYGYTKLQLGYSLILYKSVKAALFTIPASDE